MEDEVYGNKPNKLVKEASISFKPGCSVLDIGCGRGKDSVYLARKGFAVTAVDRIEKFTKDLGVLARNEALNLTPVTADVKESDKLSRLGCFDVIISMNLLQILYKDFAVDPLIYWIKLHTKPSGYDVIETFTVMRYKQKINGSCRVIHMFGGNGFSLRERYWDWEVEQYHEYWGGLESHKEEPEKHSHYSIQLIAKNIRPSHWRQYGSNLSREE